MFLISRYFSFIEIPGRNCRNVQSNANKLRQPLSTMPKKQNNESKFYINFKAFARVLKQRRFMICQLNFLNKNYFDHPLSVVSIHLYARNLHTHTKKITMYGNCYISKNINFQAPSLTFFLRSLNRCVFISVYLKGIKFCGYLISRFLVFGLFSSSSPGPWTGAPNLQML